MRSRTCRPSSTARANNFHGKDDRGSANGHVRGPFLCLTAFRDRAFAASLAAPIRWGGGLFFFLTRWNEKRTMFVFRSRETSHVPCRCRGSCCAGVDLAVHRNAGGVGPGIFDPVGFVWRAASPGRGGAAPTVFVEPVNCAVRSGRTGGHRWAGLPT